MNKNSKIKITCKNCGRISFIQVISKPRLYPKYCPKCGFQFGFLQKLKHHIKWILLGIHDNIKNQ